jgi:hypothetical protein
MSTNGRTPPVATAGLGESDLTSGDGAISPPDKASRRERQRDGYSLARKIDLFELRCFDCAERVNTGDIAFLDAIDVLFDSAVASGLADQIGTDSVQEIMHNAWAEVRKPRGEPV